MKDWKALVRARLGALPVDPARASDIVDELAQHVAQHHAELTASGMSDADAVERALAPLDGSARVASEIERADRPRPSAPVPPAERANVFTDLFRDVKYGVRVLMRSPGFVLAAIIPLALGIGANTAIFSVVNSVLLRPLPYTDPDRLVQIGERETDGSAANVGFTTFADWRDRSHGFDEMALIRSWAATLITDGQPERVVAMRVSANFFHMLGLRPALGRDFRTDDDTPAAWRVLILSDGLWRRRFNADPAVLGRSITMNDQPFTIVGVMPASFEPLMSEHFYQRAEMWAPLGYDRSLPNACRDCQHLKAFGRLKPSTTIEGARQDLDGVHAQLRREHPNTYARSVITLVPLAEELTHNVRPILLVLMGAVVFVLLIACANIANLFLARLAARERDLSLRAALGASRSRLIRQLFVESALLACAGAAAGALLAAWAVPLLTRLAPPSGSRLASAAIDGRVLLFAIGLSGATALLFGLLPSIRSARVDVQDALHGQSRSVARGSSSARRMLLAADVALAVVLLIGAGLMIKSVGRLVGVSPGFDPNHVLTMQIAYAGKAYAKNETVVDVNRRMIATLKALPGVESVATASQIPLGGNVDSWGFHIQSRPSPNPAENPSLERYGVTPAYFDVMRIPLVRGRLIDDSDVASAEPAMLINERAAQRLWPGGDPIGEHVRIGDPSRGPWRKIVGVVGDVRHRDLAAPPTMQMYTPQAQLTDSFLTVVIRAKGDEAQLAAATREAIWSVARDAPISEVAPLNDLVARSVGPRRFVMVLLQLFGAVALVMTAVGVYGVISYSVAERTREIGIRTALGATASDIMRLVVGGGMATVGGGLAAGVVAAIGVTRFLRGSLFNVSATDPATFAAVAVVLLLVALAAQSIPVVRATRVDPTVALKQE